MFVADVEVVDDFPGENAGMGEIVGFFAALLPSRSIGSRLRASELSIMSPKFGIFVMNTILILLKNPKECFDRLSMNGKFPMNSTFFRSS